MATPEIGSALVEVVGGSSTFLALPVKGLVANYVSGQWGWRQAAWIADKAFEFRDATYKLDKVFAYGIAALLLDPHTGPMRLLGIDLTDPNGNFHVTCRAVCLTKLAVKFTDRCNQITLLVTRIHNTYCGLYVSTPESQYLRWKHIARDCAELALVVMLTADTVLRTLEVLRDDTSMRHSIQQEGCAYVVETVIKYGRNSEQAEAYLTQKMGEMSKALNLPDINNMGNILSNLCSKAIEKLALSSST